MRRHQRKVLAHPGSKSYNELLTPNLQGLLEVLWSRVPSRTSGPVFQHEGEDFGLVLKGELTCYVGEERYVLRAGDSITFKRTILHHYENASRRPVEAIWVVTPPSI